jgi:glycosyltransferase involved in cell wall biosynthesis
VSRVSIFLPSYNHAPYLREAIDGILAQTYQDFELFIEDDASTDESWSIIQGYTDPRIRAFRNPENRHDKQDMRRVIYELATGEYIAIQHSDNVWEPGKLQQQVDFLDAHPGTGAVFTHVQLIGEDGRPFEDPLHTAHRIFDQPNRDRHAWLNFFFYRGNALCHPSVLIRRQCHDECGFYRSGLAQLVDLDMWVRLCLKYEIHVIPEKLVRFRIRRGELNQGGDRPGPRVRTRFELLQVMENYLRIPTFEELVRILPAAEPYRRSAGCDIGYVLGRVTLDTRGNSPVAMLFGMQTLFDAVSDPARAARIKDLYGFTHKDLIAITGQHDVFPVESNVALLLARIGGKLFPEDTLPFRALRRWFRSVVVPRGMLR